MAKLEANKVSENRTNKLDDSNLMNNGDKDNSFVMRLK